MLAHTRNYGGFHAAANEHGSTDLVDPERNKPGVYRCLPTPAIMAFQQLRNMAALT